MRKYWLAILLISLLPLLVAAQETSGFRNHGYSFVAPGGLSGESEALLHFGVGGVGRIKGNFGLGAEAGYVYCTRCGINSGIGLFSINGSYHFATSRAPKVAPFVTAGYSGAFRQGYANLLNFGAGVDYWFRPRMGLKAEFRDHLHTSGGASHLWEARLAFIFR